MDQAAFWIGILLSVIGVAASAAGVVAILIRERTERTLWLLAGWLFACVAIGGNVLYQANFFQTSMAASGRVGATVVLDVVIFAIGGIIVVSFRTSTGNGWAASIIWALTCLAIGGVGGMLFGIPRTESGHSPIEQIADWLTKIIVGIGLVNLGKIPGKLAEWAKYAGACIDSDESTQHFALGIILYFTLLGFVSGYLLTSYFLKELLPTAGAASGGNVPGLSGREFIPWLGTGLS